MKGLPNNQMVLVYSTVGIHLPSPFLFFLFVVRLAVVLYLTVLTLFSFSSLSREHESVSSLIHLRMFSVCLCRCLLLNSPWNVRGLLMRERGKNILIFLRGLCVCSAVFCLLPNKNGNICSRLHYRDSSLFIFVALSQSQTQCSWILIIFLSFFSFFLCCSSITKMERS